MTELSNVFCFLPLKKKQSKVDVQVVSVLQTIFVCAIIAWYSSNWTIKTDRVCWNEEACPIQKLKIGKLCHWCVCVYSILNVWLITSGFFCILFDIILHFGAWLGWSVVQQILFDCLSPYSSLHVPGLVGIGIPHVVRWPDSYKWSCHFRRGHFMNPGMYLALANYHLMDNLLVFVLACCHLPLLPCLLHEHYTLNWGVGVSHWGGEEVDNRGHAI